MYQRDKEIIKTSRTPFLETFVFSLQPPTMKPTPILSKQPLIMRKPIRQDPEPKDDIWVLRSEVEANATGTHVSVSSNANSNQPHKELISKSIGPTNEDVPVTGVVIAQPRVLIPQPYIFSTPMSVISSTPSTTIGQTPVVNNLLLQASSQPKSPIPIVPSNFPISQSHLISPSAINAPSGMLDAKQSIVTGIRMEETSISHSFCGPPSGRLPPEPRPPPPPPPPRLTPVASSSSSKSSSVPVASSSSSSSMANNTSSSGSSNASSSNTMGGTCNTQPHNRIETPNPVAQNRLHLQNQNGPAFHESPDEGYHEDEGGSETM